MKAHVRNTVRNVLRRDRSRSRSRSRGPNSSGPVGPPVASTSPSISQEAASSRGGSGGGLPEEDDDIQLKRNSQRHLQQKRSHHFPPFRSFSRAPSPSSASASGGTGIHSITRSRTFRWGHHDYSSSAAAGGSTHTTSEDTSVNSVHRRNSFFSSHRRKSHGGGGRESETESTDHESHHQRWPQRIFSRLRRNKSIASRGGAADGDPDESPDRGGGDGSGVDPELASSASSWRARLGRRKSRSVYPQNPTPPKSTDPAAMMGSPQSAHGAETSSDYDNLPPSSAAYGHQHQSSQYLSQQLQPQQQQQQQQQQRYGVSQPGSAGNRRPLPNEGQRSSYSPVDGFRGAVKPQSDSFAYGSNSGGSGGTSQAFRTSNSSVYIRPTDTAPMRSHGGEYPDEENDACPRHPAYRAAPRDTLGSPSRQGESQRSYLRHHTPRPPPPNQGGSDFECHSGRKTLQYDHRGSYSSASQSVNHHPAVFPPTHVSDTLGYGSRQPDTVHLSKSPVVVAAAQPQQLSRHRVPSVVVANSQILQAANGNIGQTKKSHQTHGGWSPQDTITPGTESTRATELDSPYRDEPGTSNETDCNALNYSPQKSPASPIEIQNVPQRSRKHDPQQRYDRQASSIDQPFASSTAGAHSQPEQAEHSVSNQSLIDISCASWALSVHGTPVDLTHFFCPKTWTPERFKSLKRLAPAIHGEVRYVLDMVEKKSVVVKVIRNSAVRPRSPGELENPLVEIGAMTYLHSNKSVYPVDLVAKLMDVYQDAKYTYLVTEYCSEGELFREVVARKCLSERHVKAIALQLTIALYSLHKNGICHRDVSLENTLLQNDRSIRLIDFGQAEAIHEPDGRPKYMTGSAGKAYYRAPEMLRGSYLGPPVDVFALGVEIFIMAVGSPPWQKASLQDARYRNLTKCSTALDVALRKWGKRAHLSDAFVDILASIFCSEPSMRPTVEDLLYHPWFAFDSGVWRWVYARGCSKTIRSHAERVEKYLRLHPQGKYFARPCMSSTMSNTAAGTGDQTPSEAQ